MTEMTLASPNKQHAMSKRTFNKIDEQLWWKVNNTIKITRIQP
jgi:hypothetical protein